MRCFFMQKSLAQRAFTKYCIHIHCINKQALKMAHINNVVQLSFAFDGEPKEVSRVRGWSYLLADSVAFKKDVPHTIRMQKPAEEQVPAWISRLITSGQCKTIYVENLALDEAQRVLIKQLCQRYAVSVVNLKVTNEENGQQRKNVVMGLW